VQFPLRVALHAPEYYHGKLLDLCAQDEATRQHSLEVMRRSLETARRLREACFPAHEGPVPVILHPGA